MTKITDSEGGVPPVTPVYPTTDRRKIVPENIKRSRPTRRDEKKPVAEGNDGFSLADVTPQQADELLALPLMRERDAGSNDYFKLLEDRYFQQLRAALAKKRDGAETDHMDDAVLINAEQVLDKITTLKTPGALLAEIGEFKASARTVGTINPIRRG